MKNQLDRILQKRMDRKDFLKQLGLGLVVMVGLGSLVKLLKPDVAPKTGYGSSVYGGKTPPKS